MRKRRRLARRQRDAKAHLDNLHDSKTTPLHADLSDAQQSRHTGKLIDLLTACDVGTRSRQDQNICKRAGAACGAEEDKVWREAVAGSEADDADVLWEVGDENAQEDETGDN